MPIASNTRFSWPRRLNWPGSRQASGGSRRLNADSGTEALVPLDAESCGAVERLDARRREEQLVEKAFLRLAKAHPTAHRA